MANKFAGSKGARKSTKGSAAIRKTTNFEGGEAYTLPIKQRLANRVMTALINEKKFYGDNTDELLEDIKQAGKECPEFLMKLAAYTRNVMNFRSSPVFVLGHGSLIPEVKPYVRKWTPKIVQRADELAELISLINSTSKERVSIPNSLKKGIADSLGKFKAYHLMKYKGTGKEVNLWDVFNICHPKPSNEEQAELWKKFMNGELKPAQTWEVTQSKAGQTGQSKKEAWEEIIPKMGYMAIIRNLRNFVKEEISEEAFKMVIDKLTNPEAVKHNKQLPFRYWTAYRELEGRSDSEGWNFYAIRRDELLDAIDRAFALSMNNISQLPGNTAIFSDHSSSMRSPIADRSSVALIDIACVLHSIADSVSEKGYGVIFGQTAKVKSSRGLSPLRYVQSLIKDDVGHSTNVHLAFSKLIESGKKVDRIIVLSDLQVYDSNYWRHDSASVRKLFDQYRKEINPDAWLHSVDLAGYGTAFNPMSQKNTALYAGWTNRFLDLLAQVEKGENSLVAEIEAYE